MPAAGRVTAVDWQHSAEGATAACLEDALLRSVALATFDGPDFETGLPLRIQRNATL